MTNRFYSYLNGFQSIFFGSQKKKKKNFLKFFTNKAEVVKVIIASGAAKRTTMSRKRVRIRQKVLFQLNLLAGVKDAGFNRDAKMCLAFCLVTRFQLHKENDDDKSNKILLNPSMKI